MQNVWKTLHYQLFRYILQIYSYYCHYHHYYSTHVYYKIKPNKNDGPCKTLVSLKTLKQQYYAPFFPFPTALLHHDLLNFKQNSGEALNRSILYSAMHRDSRTAMVPSLLPALNRGLNVQKNHKDARLLNDKHTPKLHIDSTQKDERWPLLLLPCYLRKNWCHLKPNSVNPG